MRFDVLTLFPDMVSQVLGSSILKRAQQGGSISVATHDIRSVTTDTHHTVDDTPYGGGSGMLLKVDILHQALQKAQATIPADLTRRRVILITPGGRRFTQRVAEEYAANYDQLTFVCGHYEGFDERFVSFVDEELSLGEFVLTGGELPTLCVIDAVSRLVPGVLGDSHSHVEESYSIFDTDGTPLVEYPQYTRPLSYQGMEVPEILLSGHHENIRKWRLEQARLRTHDHHDQ